MLNSNFSSLSVSYRLSSTMFFHLHFVSHLIIHSQIFSLGLNLLRSFEFWYFNSFHPILFWPWNLPFFCVELIICSCSSSYRYFGPFRSQLFPLAYIFALIFSFSILHCLPWVACDPWRLLHSSIHFLLSSFSLSL